MSCSLHDAARFEALGLPTAVIATDAFVRPADDQLAALNFASYRPYLVVIPHPLASLPRAEVEAKADAATAGVAAAVSGARLALVPNVPELLPRLVDAATPGPRPADLAAAVQASVTGTVPMPMTALGAHDEEACDT